MKENLFEAVKEFVTKLLVVTVTEAEVDEPLHMLLVHY